MVKAIFVQEKEGERGRSDLFFLSFPHPLLLLLPIQRLPPNPPCNLARMASVSNTRARSHTGTHPRSLARSLSLLLSFIRSVSEAADTQRLASGKSEKERHNLDAGQLHPLSSFPHFHGSLCPRAGLALSLSLFFVSCV